jgi:phosphoglucosamine mutase
MTEQTMFGTDGIRGRANEHPLTPEGVLRLGQCFAATLLEDDSVARVVVGRDTRGSGPMLQAALTAGLTTMGVAVDDAGVLPTPAIALYAKSTGASAGVVISASHNPFEDNGLKFFRGDGFKLVDAQEARITALFLDDQNFVLVDPAHVGSVRDVSVAAGEHYRSELLAVAGGMRLDGIKIAVDCANGAASITTPSVLAGLGADLIVGHAEPNGMNINAGCGSTFPMEIAGVVKATGAVAGVTHDGDADRVLIADETGSILDGDEIMAIVAIHLAASGQLRGNTIVATVMSNLGLDETLSGAEIGVKRSGVGDRQVLELMRANNLVFGGEQSGHFIFLEHATTGDGLLAALVVLSIMRQTGKPLSELRRVLVRYPQVQCAVKVVTKPPLEMVPAVTEAIKLAEAELGRKGRVLVRYSGTESKLRVLVEGPDVSVITKLLDGIADAASKALGG